MRWVKLTLPPLVRDRWLLRIVRLTSSSLAGTWRTLVAVGTPRLASMLETMRAPAPRRGVGAGSSPSAAGDGCGRGGAWGCGGAGRAARGAGPSVGATAGSAGAEGRVGGASAGGAIGALGA